MEGKKIKIELTEKDVENFKKFRKYQDDFEVLIKNNFFTFKNGKGIIHRDNSGKLRKVEIQEILFTS